MTKYIVKLSYQTYSFDYSQLNNIIDYVENNFSKDAETIRISLNNGFYSNAQVFNNKTEAKKAAINSKSIKYINYSFELITLQN